MNGVRSIFNAISAMQLCYDRVIVVLGSDEDRQTGFLANTIRNMVEPTGGELMSSPDRLASGTETRKMTWDSKVVDGKLIPKTPDETKFDKKTFEQLIRSEVGEGYSREINEIDQQPILPPVGLISNERIEDLFYKIKYSQPLGSSKPAKDQEKLYRGFVSAALKKGRDAEASVRSDDFLSYSAVGVKARVNFLSDPTSNMVHATRWEKKKSNKKSNKMSKNKKTKEKKKKMRKKKQRRGVKGGKRTQKRKYKRTNKQKTRKRKRKRKTRRRKKPKMRVRAK
jgi:hypothetical protein